MWKYAALYSGIFAPDQACKQMYSCVARSSFGLQFNTTLSFLHAYRTQYVSKRPPAVASRQGAVWNRRQRGALIGRDRNIPARAAHDALHSGGSRLLRQGLAARTSMDAAASPARSHLAQLGRTSQRDARNKIRRHHFDGVDDGHISLDLCQSAMDTNPLAGVGINRGGDRVADTDTRAQLGAPAPINHRPK